VHHLRLVRELRREKTVERVLIERLRLQKIANRPVFIPVWARIRQVIEYQKAAGLHLRQCLAVIRNLVEMNVWHHGRLDCVGWVYLVNTIQEKSATNRAMIGPKALANQNRGLGLPHAKQVRALSVKEAVRCARLKTQRKQIPESVTQNLTANISA